MNTETVTLYEIAAQEDRCAPRTKLAIPAQLRMSGARPCQTIVNDLSLSAFSAAAITRLHPGTLCWLTLPGLEALQARVVWWENNLCGCAIAALCVATLSACGGGAGCAFHNLLSPIVHDTIQQRWRRDADNQLR